MWPFSKNTEQLKDVTAGANNVKLTVEAAEGLWEKFMPVSREEALKILTRDLPSGTTVCISIHDNGCGAIKMWADGIFRESSDARYDPRPFDLREGGCLGEGLLEVDSAHRGSNVGRYVLRNELEFFYLCGIRRFDIHPALSVGGYVWARNGFLPLKMDEGAFVHGTKEPVRERYEALRPLLPEDMCQVLDDAVNFKDPADIWRIADQGQISGRLEAVFNDIANRPDDADDSDNEANEGCKIKKVFNKKGASHYDYPTWGEGALSNIRSAIKAGKKVTVGQILLSGTNWYGRVDMTNGEQMKRFGSYVGGFQRIAVGA